jgi:hypothetical protein
VDRFTFGVAQALTAQLGELLAAAEAGPPRVY